MRTITVYLEPDQFAALRELSKRTRVSASTYMRDGVDCILRREGFLPPLGGGVDP